MSGCVGPKEMTDRLSEAIVGGEKYEWKNRLDENDTFSLMDMLNLNLAEKEDYLFIIREDTKHIHIEMEAEFSNPINKNWEIFNQGSINFTICSPSGKNYSRSYNTILKEKTYKDEIFIPDHEIKSGVWKVVVTARGWGKNNYRIKVEAYELVDKKGIFG
jgi:hypothetical protein